MTIKLILGCTFILLLNACSSPYSVRKVNLSDSTSGPRYCLKRPQLKLRMQIPVNESKIFDLKSCDNRASSCKNLISGKSERIDIDEYNRTLEFNRKHEVKTRYCLSKPADGRVKFDFVLSQSLGKKEYFEVKQGYSFLGLADSEFELNVDEEGCFSSMSAKETDKSLETITALATFRVSKLVDDIADQDNGVSTASLEDHNANANVPAEGVNIHSCTNLEGCERIQDVNGINMFALGVTPGMNCLYFPEAKSKADSRALKRVHNSKFQRYLQRHTDQVSKFNSISRAIDSTYSQLFVSNAEDRKNHLANLISLRKLKAEYKAKLGAVGFLVPKNKYSITLDGSTVNHQHNTGDSAPSSEKNWFDIELTAN